MFPPEKFPGPGSSAAVRICYKQHWADFLAAWYACDGSLECQTVAYDTYCKAVTQCGAT